MKKIHLLLLLLCCFGSTLTMGETLESKSYNSEGEIDLSGDLPAGKQRSLLKPIQAFIIGQSIKADFNDAMGTIIISIFDEAGNAVYQQSVNTYAGQQIFIDITSFSLGKYTIEFVNSRNEYLSGEFEI